MGAVDARGSARKADAMRLNHQVEWFYDGFAADRSLVLLVSDYTLVFLRVSSLFFVAADEARGCDRVRSARKSDDCGASESPG